MIVKRTKKFYYISTSPDIGKDLISPTIPNNYLTKNGYSDNKIKRIELYTTIDDAISGKFLDQNLEGMELYVYSTEGINYESLLGPISITMSPIASILDEYWYLKSLRLRYVTKIKILNKKESKQFKYGIKQQKGLINIWNWEEVLKSWEKSKL